MNIYLKTVFLLMALPISLAAEAHHSFSAEFDLKKPVHLEGEVVKMEWVNPHSWLHVAVENEDGVIENWKIEGGAPSALLRRGWSRDSLPAGTKVIVDGFQARDNSLRANSQGILFPDGRVLNLGASRAPKE